MSEDYAYFPVTSNAAQKPGNGGRFIDLIKRFFDLTISLLGIILLAPFLLYLVWRIKRDSPGPIFYRGERAGRGGKTFCILKFRSMYERPESFQGPRVTAQDDPRITPLGHWLRDTKLNELPQLWNVLKGDMSLVGPRPEDPEIAKTWPEEVRREILSVRPGVTSPASVIYRDEEVLLSNSKVMETYLSDILPSKLRLDQLYVRHRSFWGDLDIIFWTVLILLPRVRSYAPSEKRLFVGPIAQLMRHHVSWFIIDTAITFAAMGLTGLFWRSFGPLDIGWRAATVLALGFAILFSFTNVILGVNRIEWSRAAATDVIDLLPGAILATIIALMSNYFYPISSMKLLYGGEIPAWITRPLLPPGMILLASGIAYIGFVTVRYRSRLVTGLATRWVDWRGPASATLERVLIVGGGGTGQFAAWVLSKGAYSGRFQIIGYVDDDLYKQDTRLHGVNVLGQRTDIPALVEKKDVGIIIFAIHNISASERREVLEICSSTPARVVVFPDIPAALNGLAHNGNKKSQKAVFTSKQVSANTDLLPCHLCLTKVSPLKVDDWLAQLEELAYSGDMESLQTRIKTLRRQMRSDVAVQSAANLGVEHETP